ncbi:YeeE/YedE family protein [Marinobacter fonticola]|uniref:YeeE/YedE family protein n=1 Tax=Marinobacter fonticola TaxID=2603215 RepID=UPI0011E89370|nr:YeeE/YedE family protein [Marinobacter fonticola]
MEWGSYIQGAVGGLLIGLSAVTLMATLGRIAGISGMVSGLIFDRFTTESAWRLAFLLGLLSGPLLMVMMNGSLGNVAGNPEAVVGEPIGGVLLMAVAGFLVGLGSGIGNGCTSGHGVCGIARLSPRSIWATLVFLLTGIATVYFTGFVTGP